MVKISCPKCEVKKFTFFLIRRGNIPGANMNLLRISFLSILREIIGERSSDGFSWN